MAQNPGRLDTRYAFKNDYFHRVNTVDFHITLTQFAAANGHEISLARQYFTRLPKKGTAPARPSTSIDLKPGYIDPDSTYMLTDPDGTERLLLVEIANGHKVDRVAKKTADLRPNHRKRRDQQCLRLWPTCRPDTLAL